MNGEDRFMDFFNHIQYTRNGLKNTYFTIYHACFPPFIYLIYYFFGKLLPSNAIIMFDANQTSTYAYLLFIIYNLLIVLFLYIVIRKILNKYSEFETTTLTILTVFSSTVIWTIERGNACLLVTVILIYAMYFNACESKIINELALILIAIASACKIYPCLFGFIFLKQREYKKCMRLLVYGVLFFFVPFIFLGGIDGFKQFISNQLLVQSLSGMYPEGINTIYYVLKKIGLDNYYLVFESIAFIILIYLFINSQELWKQVFIIVVCIIVLPKGTGEYVRCYLLLPVLLYLRNEKTESKYDLLMSVLFLPLYFSVTLINRSNVHLNDYIVMGSLFSIAIIMIIEKIKIKILK